MILHEICFAGLSASDRPAALTDAVIRDFGSVEQSHAQYSAMGKAQGGGSGHRDE
jgi:superoxide dismutase, Fe-Mn family